MRTRRYATFLMALLLCILIAFAPRAKPLSRNSLEVYATPQRLVLLPGGRRMNVYCRGLGSPGILLEAGLGSTTLAWRKVHAELAKSTRVCAYDRAGLGFSDPGALPRTSSAIVADLEALLKAADIRPPYILVARSFGSLPTRLFADKHLNQVAGMVLVDPSVEYQEQRFTEVSPNEALENNEVIDESRACIAVLEDNAFDFETRASKCVEPQIRDIPESVNIALRQMQLKSSYQRAALSELEGLLGPSSAEVAAARKPFGDIPLIVLTAANTFSPNPGRPGPSMEAMRELWLEMHRELATLSSRGVHRLVEGSGHNIQLERPQLVIAAVIEVLRAARSPAP